LEIIDPPQIKVLKVIVRWRTSALGGHRDARKGTGAPRALFFLNAFLFSFFHRDVDNVGNR